MGLEIKHNVSLAEYTTLHVGGVADYFAKVTSKEEVREAGLFAQQAKVPFVVLGGGSNVLIADGQHKVLVIKNEIEGIVEVPCGNGSTRLIVGAGENWDALVEHTISQGLCGLENLSGIPGTVGAAPVQNINAYGVTVSDFIESVEVYDVVHDMVVTLQKAECHFGYRDSLFKRPEGASYIVLSVTFVLAFAIAANTSYRSASQSIETFLRDQYITTPTASDVRHAVLHVRSNIGMLLGQFNSAGSFFKNTVVGPEQFIYIKEIVEKDFADISERLTPWYWSMQDAQVKIATAFLLECTSYNKHTYKNKRFNGVVGISPLHSLSIITEDGATASDVVLFVQEIKTAVENIFSVSLETEVDYFFL